MKAPPRTDRPDPDGRDPVKPYSDPAVDTPPSRADALAIGARLDEFQIERVIGASGFGVVYLATDLGLQRRVAIKEYLPDTLTVRAGDGAQVLLRADSHADAFERGRRAFVEEAQMLARCHHPSLVHVLRHWEAHGTVYRAMPHYPGTSLLQLRQAMDAPPDEASLRALLDGLLDALAMLHEAGCAHQEITPSKILLLPDDRPVLMDWGAARRAIVGDQARALMSLLAPSFAPPELTSPAPDRPIGPWTDLYALAAVVRYCISGQLPSPTALRAMPADEPLGRMLARMQQSDAALQFSPSFVRAVEAALKPLSKDRPQSVPEFRALLDDHPAAQPVPDEVTDPGARDTGWGRISGEEDMWPEPLTESVHTPRAAPQPPPTATMRGDPADNEQDEPGHEPPAVPLPAQQASAAPRQEPPAATPDRGPAAPWHHPRAAREVGGAAKASTAATAPAMQDDDRFGSDRSSTGVFADRRDDSRGSPGMMFSFRHAARRRRRRAAASSAIVLAAAIGAGIWLVERERNSQEAQSAFARAAREDGLTANLPAIRQRQPAQTPEGPPAPREPAAASGAVPSDAAASGGAAGGSPTTPSVRTAPAADPAGNTAVATASPDTPAAVPAPQPDTASSQGARLPDTADSRTTADTTTAAATPAGGTTEQEMELPASHTAARPATARSSVTSSGTRAAAPARSKAKATTSSPKTTTPSRTAAREPEGPRELCGNRTQFSLYRCMQNLCEQTRWYAHPSCKRLRLRDEVD